MRINIGRPLGRRPVYHKNRQAIQTPEPGFEGLARIDEEGKVVSAWILPDGNPTKYLSVDFVGPGFGFVIDWFAAYGTSKVTLHWFNGQPSYFPSLFSDRGGVQFFGGDALAKLSSFPTDWPGASSEVIIIAAIRHPNNVNGSVFSYGQRNVGERGLLTVVFPVTDDRILATVTNTSSISPGPNDPEGYHTIAMILRSVGGLSVYRDGVLVSNAPAPFPNPITTTATMGARLNDVGALVDFWTGQVSSVVVLNGNATFADFQEVEAEMRARIALPLQDFALIDGSFLMLTDGLGHLYIGY